MNTVEDVLRDEGVRREVAAVIGSGRGLPGAERVRVSPEMVGAVIESPSGRGRPALPNTEAVILEFGRPSLLVRDNRFRVPESVELRARLLPARRRLELRLPSVGRIEFKNHPRLPWGGTGWLIDDKVVATNAHVARNFAMKSGRGYKAIVDPVTAQAVKTRIDFREEHTGGGASPSFEVAVRKVLFMADEDRRVADVALLELASADGLPAPIPVARANPSPDLDIAVVGYPSRHFGGGVASPAMARQIFDDIYDVKRLSPGRVLVVEDDDFFFTHDATTLRGSSGSVVLDLEGNAVGLHFSGELEQANYAVKPGVVLDRLARTRRGSRATVPRAPEPAAAPPEDAVVEGNVADYEDRTGYDPAFLGDKAALRVDLPKKTTNPRDVLTFGPGSARTSELKYEHFSVAMSRSRKLCVWSAVNIDGAQKASARRTPWRIDPRIPNGAQTIGGKGELDVYGNAPRFARGHMTRREDPIWGPVDVAKRGNDDSMHLTNAVPQMQPFNAGIWLGLEEYALQHCVDDKVRINVFTGPVFDREDPERYGVRIPLRFWKVIAFVHDDTKQLTATGYVLSQESFLAPQEFVYGQYETAQKSLREIEGLTGLSFGKLRNRDPLRRRPEGPVPPLGAFSDIVLA